MAQRIARDNVSYWYPSQDKWETSKYAGRFVGKQYQCWEIINNNNQWNHTLVTIGWSVRFASLSYHERLYVRTKRPPPRPYNNLQVTTSVNFWIWWFMSLKFTNMSSAEWRTSLPSPATILAPKVYPPTVLPNLAEDELQLPNMSFYGLSFGGHRPKIYFRTAHEEECDGESCVDVQIWRLPEVPPIPIFIWEVAGNAIWCHLVTES